MADFNLIAKVHREIVDFGMHSQRERLDAARANLDFYEGKFLNAPVRPMGNTAYDSSRYPRHSLIMQRIVNVLTNNLYAEGPVRKLAPKEGDEDRAYESATLWLQECYRRNKVDSMWQEADRMACVSEVAAFQVSAWQDPEWPVRITLLDASQFCVWPNRDQPLVPELVAVLDVVDGRRRIRLYSDETIGVYMTRDSGDSEGSSTPITQDYQFIDERRNPYGVLPFSFVHFNLPVRSFWNGSPGNGLRMANDGINFKMTETFDCIRYNLRPVVTLKDVRPDWKPPAPIFPGDVWNLAGASDSTMEVSKDPTASYLQADPSFVEADWQDTQSFIDHTLEMHGVPPSVIRMTQDSVRSGVAIVAEQLPVIQWAKSRQKPFGYYEEDLARLVLKIGASHLGRQQDEEYRVTAADLEAVSMHPGLVLKWPNMYPRIPGEDQDRADEFELEKKLISKTMLLMERKNLTREEAEEMLEEIAEDLKNEQKLFSDVEPDLGTALGAIGAHELQVANENGEE
jgi:Phage portal protein, SPP1 Gp6-like